ncbi:class B sortase [Anaerotignum sp. MSJ-24]|uniref:class B sortase n=1 Tax=Anaerotignum sp. MSJ-24 TaxID=2841521 RepID=UPI001C106740|nr:class B sortase [Anaerotignum sp. MSJ-24]MBU5464869.1 class B sortase [Anaerotignum sp. MSJ-24]
MMNRKHNAKHKNKYRILSIVALCIALLLTAFLIATSLIRHNERVQTSKICELYYGNNNSVTKERDDYSDLKNKNSECDDNVDLNTEQIQDRFILLLQINPETVGWIKVGNLADEPVVYRDNEFYLNHDFYQKKSSSGTVFVDVENTDLENDKYVIVYGHDLRDGSKFGSLKEYLNIEQLKNNIVIEWSSLYSSEAEKYVVFSVFDSSMLEENKNYFDLRRFDEIDLDGTKKIIEEIRERSLYDIPVDVTAEDQIMVLVTCSYKHEDGRLLIFCRKARKAEDVNTLLESMDSIVKNN